MIHDAHTIQQHWVCLEPKPLFRNVHTFRCTRTYRGINSILQGANIPTSKPDADEAQEKTGWDLLYAALLYDEFGGFFGSDFYHFFPAKTPPWRRR